MNKKKQRELITIIFVCLSVACVMTACMNSAGDPTPSTTSGLPAATHQPTATPMTDFDWTRNSETVENNLKRISELSDARVVTAGNTALVAVRFSSAYQGEMTARIREMIAGEVMRADPNIKTVAVTAENDDVTRVYELSDRLRAGNAVDTLENDINEIIRNATTLT